MLNKTDIFFEAPVGSLWYFKQLPGALLSQGEFVYITVYANRSDSYLRKNKRWFVQAGTPVMKLIKKPLQARHYYFFKVLHFDTRNKIKVGWISQHDAEMLLIPYKDENNVRKI